MVTRLRRRLEREDGLSLVEMMVGIFLLLLSLAAMASVLITVLASIASAEQQTRANQLGNELLENLQSIHWDKVGFYASDSPSTAEGTPVLLAEPTRPLAEAPTSPHPGGCSHPQAPAGDAAPVPQESVEREGVCYDIERWIIWENGGNGDYKRFVIEVSWTTRGAPRTLRVAGSRAPGPGEFVRMFTADLATDPLVTTVSYDANPPTVATPSTLTFVGTTSSPAAVAPTLTWNNAGVDTPVLAAPLANADRTEWTWAVNTLLPFPDGDVVFTFKATSQETSSLAAEATFTVRFATGAPAASVSVQSFSLSQNAVLLAAPGPIITKTSPAAQCGKPDPALQIEVDMKGLDSTADGQVAIGWNGLAAPLTASYNRPNLTGDGSVFRLTVNNDRLPETPVRFQVYYDGAEPPTTVLWTDSTNYNTSGPC